MGLPAPSVVPSESHWWAPQLFPDENTEALGSIPPRPRELSSDPLCLQRLAAVQQALNSHRISFILRGGLRILVDLRDTDEGDRPVLGPLWVRVGMSSGQWMLEVIVGLV